VGLLFFYMAEQEMDGKAITFGLASAPGHDWLRDVVPVFGQRLKVHNALRTLVAESQPLSPTSADASPISSPVGFHTSPTSSMVWLFLSSFRYA